MRPREGCKHIRGGDGGSGRDSTGGRGRDGAGGGGGDGGRDGGRNWRRWLEQKREKSQEQPPTRPLLIVNGPLNGHLLLQEAPAHITGALSAAKRTPVPIQVCGM